MRLKQVKMPDDLAAEAENYAANLGVSFSALVRASLRSAMDRYINEIDVADWEDPGYRAGLARQRTAARARELLEAS